MNHELVGEVAAGFSAAAYVLYIVTILFPGKVLDDSSKPNRASWWMLTVIGFLIAESYESSGADSTLPVALVNSFGPLFIAILSLHKRFGVGGWEGNDKWCLGLVTLSVALRLTVFQHNPKASLFLNIAIDLVAIWPTIQKSYSSPESEGKWPWVLTVVASIINVFAINEWTPSKWTQPIYLFVFNSLILALLVRNGWCRAAVRRFGLFFSGLRA